VVQASLDEALKFFESAIIYQFNGFWPRMIALHNWIRRCGSLSFLMKLISTPMLGVSLE